MKNQTSDIYQFTLSDPDWERLKNIANECGIFTDQYGDPVCSDWDAVLRFAVAITNPVTRK